MVSLTLEKAGVSRATLLRLISAMGSAAVFGMLAAPVTRAAYWPSAFALAFIYGFFFVGGTGYRILIAAAFQDASRKASASWSGATAASALAALATAILLGLDRQPGNEALLLAAYAVAINVAYVPVKFACVDAGCCHAQRRDPFIIRTHDLRRVEIATSAMAVAMSLTAIWGDAFGMAAILGIGGHLSIRLLSRWSRNRLPGSGLEDEVKGQELLPLAMLLALSLWVTALS